MNEIQTNTKELEFYTNAFADFLGGPRHREEAKQFAIEILTVIAKSPTLQGLVHPGGDNAKTRLQFYSGCLQLLKLGLSPDPQFEQAAFVPFNTRGGHEIKLNIMYKGLIAIARKNGISINAQIVYDNDTFSLDVAMDTISHCPNTEEKRGAVKGYYCIAKDIKNATIITIKYMTLKEAQYFRDTLKNAQGESPWAMHFDQMALKTVIRRALSYVGLSYKIDTIERKERNTYSLGEDPPSPPPSLPEKETTQYVYDHDTQDQQDQEVEF